MAIDSEFQEFLAEVFEPVKMGYWYIPERLLEEPDELKIWALKAFEVAVRADQKKPPAKRKLKA